MRFQSVTTQKDPIHVTAHYLRPSTVGVFEVHVRMIKSGRRFTNLVADLFQKVSPALWRRRKDGSSIAAQNTLKVTTHMIFGHNGPAVGDEVLLTLNPPSPYARRVPLHCHPSEAPKQRKRGGWTFQDHIELTEEPKIQDRNHPDHPSRTNSTTVGGGGTEWGAWLGFSGKDEMLTSPALAFMVDMFANTPTMLPRSERKGLSTRCVILLNGAVKLKVRFYSWFPTVTLSIEFKAPIPKPSEFHASRTVGLYSTGKFIGHPQGRHEAYVEAWTAPTNIGEGKPVDGWRDKQICLAVSTQMSLAIPFDEVRADRETTRL